jgi:hypothetical protein
LRLTLSNGEQVLRLITTLVNQDHPAAPGFSLLAVLDTAIAGTIDAAEIVEGTLLIDDGDGRRERHERLGFASGHPRWIANVLCYESQLVYPDAGWIDGAIIPTDPILAAGPWSAPFSGGSDRYADIIPQDFFDNQWVLADGEPGDGVHALTQLSDLSLLMVPDLYSPAPLVAQENIIEPVSLAGPDFARCFDLPPVTLQGDRIFDLAGLRLDPKLPDERAKIIALQQQLTALADLLRSFIVLLDVPPGLNQRQILDWRASFASAFAAAYHPWLQVSRRDDSRNALIHIPPSAVAAGIIARQEIAFGVPQGPANVIAAAIVNVADQVSPARHDELHPQGINVYLRERDGIRLSAARTLSRDPTLRQLSVRRLLTLLARTLEQQMQWTVFEPNNSALRSELRLLLRSFLRQLFRRGAFRGATEDQAFFVRCDDSNNPPFISDAGRLIAEIGVAPAEPLEFIVLRLAREGDGTLIVQEK